MDTGAERKRLELLLEIAPKAQRVALVGTKADWDNAWGKALQDEAARRGLNLVFAEGETADFSGAFETARCIKSDAIFVALSPVTGRFAPDIGKFTVANRTPSSCGIAEMVPQGCMMAYGQSARSFVEYAMTYVDKILKGAKPGNLPIEQPTQFRLVINLRIVKAIGLTVPPALLARADELIE